MSIYIYIRVYICIKMGAFLRKSIDCGKLKRMCLCVYACTCVIMSARVCVRVCCVCVYVRVCVREGERARERARERERERERVCV